MRTLMLLALTLLASPVAAAEPPERTALIGTWYGESYQPTIRETTQELMHRHGDGSYEIEFRIYKSCELTFDSKEAGKWTVEGGVYSTDTLTVNGKAVDGGNPFYHDDYTIDRLGAGVFTYRHVNTGVVATSRKVGADFIFPGCDA